MADYRLTQSGDEVQDILNHAVMQSELNAETERATGKETQLQNNINTVQQNLNGEATTREQADTALNLFIQQVQGSLINYYLKTQTYSANEIDQMLAAIKQFRYQVVDQLPTPSAETMGIIYLVPSSHAVVGNVKDEYITLTRDEGSGVIYYFEQIGETAIDLSNYYTKAQTNAEISLAISTAIANYYTKQEVDALIANFITKSVNDLTYYYLKSETFTKDEVNQLIAAIKQFQYQSVSELPTASAATMGIIYLVPSTNPQQKNIKDEFITISLTDQGTTTYSWEQIGSTEVDLSGYYTSAQTDAAINAALASYSTTTQMTAAIATALASYYTKTEVDALIANFITKSVNDLVNYYLKTEVFTKAEVNALIAAVQQFQYVSVQTLPTASSETMNKIYLVPSTNPDTQNAKDEFITISVTDQGTTTYSWEQIGSTTVDLSGYYTSAQTDAAINAALASYSTTTQMTAAIAAALASYYTKTEVDALIANFITKSVNDLTYYYLKSETFTKTEVNQLIDAVKQFQYQSVQALPSASAQTMNIIYLVPGLSPTSQNVKDEYITIATTNEMQETVYSWEKIGTTEIDLSNYYNKTQTDAAITAAINTALASYSTTSQMTAAITAALASYYTKTEVDALIANFITKSVNDLTYYYLKTETYSATEIDTLIAAIKQFQYVSVTTLPTASASTVGKIYLVPASDPQTQNVKDEYITLTTVEEGTTFYNWEKIGSTSIDLSNYYTKTQTDAAINTALASYVTSAQMATAIATALVSYYTKTEVDALIANFITKSVNDLTYYYLKSETFTKAEVNALISAISQFTYQSVQSLPTASADTMNIIYLVPSSDPQAQNTKDEYITISSTNEQDQTVYSWEKIGSTDIDLSGYYTSTQTDAAISAALADYSTTTQMATAINTAVSGKQNAITDGAIIGLGYGVCSTAAAVAAKEATITSFLLMKNMPITIKFTSAISAANSTLNITSTGAKPLYLEGTALLPNVILGGMVATLIYDGTNYNIVQFGYAKNIANPNVVDMGLTSGTLWAKKNLDVTQADGFAASEFQYECSFFSWGNVVGHNPISTSAFSYDFGSNNSGPYASTPGALLEGDVPVNATYDIARNLLGDPWQLPEDDDFVELIAGCDYVQADGSTVIDAATTNKLVTVDGVVGIYLKSKTNGNLLFFPCSGYGYGTSWNNRATNGHFWSGSLASDPTKGLLLLFYSGGVNPQDTNTRFYGFTGRAVQHVVQPSE